MNERVGVNAFHGAGERHGCGSFAAAGFGRGETKDRAKSFAAGEEAVAHRLVDGGGPGIFLGQKAVERAIDLFRTGGEISAEFHRSRTVETSRELCAMEKAVPFALAPEMLVIERFRVYACNCCCRGNEQDEETDKI